MHTSAIIAAAGLSSRMGAFKPLLPLGEAPLILRVIENLQKAGADDIVVVTGFRSELLRSQLAGLPLTLAENPDYAVNNMFDSLCIGLRGLPGPCDAVLLTPADIPLTRPATIQKLLASPAALARPLCSGHTGHPLKISAELIPRILTWTGEGGLRGASAALGIPFTDIPAEDPGCLMDADTPADYRLLLEAARQSALFPIPPARVSIQKLPGDGLPEIVCRMREALKQAGGTGSVPDDAACEALLEAAGLPEHIRRHCRAVAAQADCLAAALPPQNIDRPLLHAAALLHDIARLEPDHAALGASYLDACGLGRIAEIVAVHHSMPPDLLLTVSEETVLYLADKQIREDAFVGIDRRFSASRAKCRSAEALRKHDQRYLEAREIELYLEKQSEVYRNEQSLHPRSV